MAGVMNSGRDLIIEIAGDKFADMLLGALRNDSERSCREKTAIWIQQVTLRPAAPVFGDSFAWTEVRSNGTTEEWWPVPLTTDKVKERFGLPSDLSLLTWNGQPVTAKAYDLRYVDQTALVVGYDLVSSSGEEHGEVQEVQLGVDAGSTPNLASWAAFQTNFLTVEGVAHDWGMAIDGALMQDLLNQRLAEQIGTDIEIQKPLPHGFAEHFHIENITGFWGNPIRIWVRGELVVSGGPDIDLEFISIGRFWVGSTGTLDSPSLNFQVEVVPESVSVDFWDGVQTVLSDPFTIGATILAGPFAGAVTGYLRWGDVDVGVGGGNEPSELITRLDFHLENGIRFRGTTVDQQIDSLRILGEAIVPIEHGGPLLGTTSSPIVFVETSESACAQGVSPVFPPQQIRLINNGWSLLSICDLKLSGDAGFTIGNAPELPIHRAPATSVTLTVRYTGPRGADASGTLRIISNDPHPYGRNPTGMIRDIALRVRSAGTPVFRFEPSPLVEIRVANSQTGVPLQRVGGCEVVSVPTRAGQFRVFNEGDGPLFLCDGVLQDPAGVFGVSYHPTTLLPHQSQEFIISFEPKAAMVDYSATFTIQSNAGPVVIPLHGRVEALPLFPGPGQKLDLNSDVGCAPPDALCGIRRYWEPVVGDDTLAVVLTTFDDVPPSSEVILRDANGIAHVRDFSGYRMRYQTLAYTPIPDGDPESSNPCVPDFTGLRPNEIQKIHVEVARRLLRPVLGFAELGNVTCIASGGGWVYAGAPDGIHVIDWREMHRPRLQKRIHTGATQTLSLLKGILFAATGEEIHSFDLSKPNDPVHQGSVKLAAQATAMAGTSQVVYAVDGTQISALDYDDGKLQLKTVTRVADGAEQLGLFRGGLYVTKGQTLSWLSTADALHPQLKATTSIPRRIESLSHFGKDILLSGGFGTLSFAIQDQSKFHPIAEYRHRHWSVDFIPDLDHQRLFKLNPKGQVELWEVLVHHLDRSLFQEALRLQYQPFTP